ncbi:hypothetical protein [Larkinella punicea]|uniref:DUF3575 domain-containing protein n=1 Tax=Larkinella punicea TaxID=2315727 RepID=A0A368JLI3_9BACT|nr:hypothetical protein [Larkinella punicea]RCR68520.1 hypothetical protein DUE52_15485 [Larkinella punicea]
MKAFLILCGLFWWKGTIGCAQSIAVQAPVDSVIKPTRHPVRWTLNLDFRNSFVNRQPVNVWGVNTGIVFGEKRHQVTVGYYWLSYNSYLRLINWHRNAARRLNIEYYTKTDMAYGSLMFWGNPINNRRWLFSIPVEIGAGKASVIRQDTQTDTLRGNSRRDFFMPVQIGVYGQWKASRWIGLSAQLGYRYSVFQTNVSQHYNGTYYSVGTTLYPEFFKDIWGFIRYRKWESKPFFSAPATL